MNFTTSLSISSSLFMLIGSLIFVPAFFLQVYKLYVNKKATTGIDLSSWIMNFFGRFTWVILGWFLQDIILIISQGLITLMTIIIIYYVIRNLKTNGIYHKEHFKKELFVFKIFMIFITLSLIIIASLFAENVLPFQKPGQEIFIPISIIATFLTGFAFFPQGLKTIKTKNTKNVSLYLSLFFAIGNTLIIFSLIFKMIEAGSNDHKEYLIRIWSIILPLISIVVMYIITFIKINNIKKYYEKI